VISIGRDRLLLFISQHWQTCADLTFPLTSQCPKKGEKIGHCPICPGNRLVYRLRFSCSRQRFVRQVSQGSGKDVAFTGFLFAPKMQLQTDVWTLSFGSLPRRTCRKPVEYARQWRVCVVERGFVGADRILTPQRVQDEDSLRAYHVPTLPHCLAHSMHNTYEAEMSCQAINFPRQPTIN
jgi:hypothetical protein